MSIKGTITTTDYIDFDIVMNTATNLLGDKKKRMYAMYMIVAVNTGLRIGDILTLTFEQLESDTLVLIEEKTSKRREIRINDAIRKALSTYTPKEKKGCIFVSQKGTTVSRQRINVVLKEVFKNKRSCEGLNISSHSLRKSFGRRVYDSNGRSHEALAKLSEILNHSDTKVTRRYLGLRKQEIQSVYMNL